MMRVLLASAALVGTMAVAGAASAQSNWAASAGIGADGVGIGLHYHVAPHWVLSGRASVAPRFSADGESNISPFHINGSAEIDGITGSVEYHPWVGAQRWWQDPAFVAVGFFAGYDRDVKLRATYAPTPTQPGYSAGGVPVTAPQIGSITGRGDVDSAIPVIGLGWDNTFSTTNRWGYRAFVGVGFGDAKSSYTATGGVYSNTPQVQGGLAAIASTTDESTEFQILKTYPVVSLSMTYKF